VPTGSCKKSRYLSIPQTNDYHSSYFTQPQGLQQQQAVVNTLTVQGDFCRNIDVEGIELCFAVLAFIVVKKEKSNNEKRVNLYWHFNCIGMVKLFCSNRRLGKPGADAADGME